MTESAVVAYKVSRVLLATKDLNLIMRVPMPNA